MRKTYGDLADELRGKAFQDAAEIEKSVFQSPASDDMKRRFTEALAKSHGVDGELPAGHYIDCLDCGLIMGEVLHSLHSQEERNDFEKLHQHVANLDNLPIHKGEVKSKTVSIDGKAVMLVETEDGVAMLPWMTADDIHRETAYERN